MTSLILALNAGSSSLKLKLYRWNKSSSSSTDALTPTHSGSVKDLNSDSPHLSFGQIGGPDGDESSKDNRVQKFDLEPSKKYEQVLSQVLKIVIDAVKNDGTIEAVVHRVVHGGGETKPALIEHGTKEEPHILEKMEKISSFAPLHNFNSLVAVRYCLEHLGPHSTSILAFDTLFHSTLPAIRTTYPVSTPPHPTPIPLRRYGFHGLSYQSILNSFSRSSGKPASTVSLVVCHLGSGASICLIENGRSTKTTMGLSPLEGLPGGTRAGTVDPTLIFHHTPDCSDMTEEGVSKGELVLNKESGFKALTGTNDFGEITQRAESGDDNDDKAKLCYELFVDRVKSYVLEYVGTALSDGVELDGVVFSGGIGEKSTSLRRDVLGSLAWLEELAGTRGGGGGLDRELNETSREGKEGVWRISKEGSKIMGWVVETDEERVCAELAVESLKEHEREKGQ